MNIGLSISFCVKDIAAGKVPYESVHLVIAGTNTDNGDPAKLQRVINAYSATYWRAEHMGGNPMFPGTPNLFDFTAQCVRICRQLYADGKVFEARAFGGEAPSTLGGPNGFWLTDETIDAYVDMLQQRGEFNA
jgi:hypothetical protein